MFPIRDHNPRGGFPVFTLCLIGLNITIYFASLPITAEPAAYAAAGGFVVGFLLMLPYFLARGGAGYWSATKGKPPHPEADYRFVKSQIPRVRRR